MKFSKYNIPVEVKEGIILYNSKLGTYVHIFNKEDYEHYKELEKTGNLPRNDKMVKSLHKHGYVVSNRANEYKEVYNAIQEYFKETEKYLSFFFYVTEGCNFRCVYCPQSHEPKAFSKENWKALYKYIEKSVKNGKCTYLSINFFGGEPLLEIDRIFEFLEKVAKLKNKYKEFDVNYKMVTNAYLLTPEVYDKLSSYNFTFFQITVDGFAETHNKSRPLANGKPTWDTIIKNLEYINTKENAPTILLRVNCNDSNYKTMNDFQKWATEHFSNPHFKLAITPVSKFSDRVNDDLLAQETEYEMTKVLKDNKKLYGNPKYKLMRLSRVCKCSYTNHYVLTVDGKITKCEQSYDGDYDYVGELTPEGDIVFNADFPKWTKNFEIKNCKNCIIYPLCAARTCPRRKFRAKKGIRTDCAAINSDVRQDIINIIKDGYLNPKKK